MKLLRMLLISTLFISLISCDGAQPNEQNTPDPLADLYGKYITECIDAGGGAYNQLYATISEETGQLSLAVLTWTNLNCKGTYKLSNFNGDSIAKPEPQETFSNFEVSDIPDNFQILKLKSINAPHDITYTIFHRSAHHLDVMSDYTTPHKKWSQWLDEPQVSAFVAAPTTYEASGDYTSFHFTPVDSLPSKLSPLQGHWISDCTDFGGGLYNQIYAEFDGEEAKSANLTWTNLGCSGTYTMTNTDGDSVTAPSVSQKISPQYVSDIPDDFFVIKVTQISNPSQINYAVLALSNDEFYEIVPYSNSLGVTWADWLTDGDVTNFAADPAAASPTMHLKLHFSAGELP